ncbi:hypothetical protein N7462_006819 [Penicillium macrosclerotiorum]|uniref:uncharacterized protein n=1 Tax=Penicillium macrosclerotiorum TaxID=303699 RepID=UPI0025492472|nr:uncharacterized protein N7462_006819 [Penicillium macrosclerotiorum]KAJ5683654.1 hypothetical protein N7462_006819 [Penicillium macrosclerotiorum]
MATTHDSGVNYGAQVGNNYGIFNAEFHAAPERPETPPDPLSTIPFARDQDFVKRDTLLHQIREKNSVPGSRIALVGLGGVGKSQLAIEYSYQIRSESPTTWVFWIHASNQARLEQSFRDIANQVKISGRREPKANIFELVENWLRDEKKGKWVCVLDNADDYEFLCLPQTVANPAHAIEPTYVPVKPLLEYIPRGRNGSVIITSRSREVVLKMVKENDLIEVTPMEPCEALELFHKRLGRPKESEESRRLVEELEFIPLAIIQAASYIRARAPRYSVSQYLQDFQSSDRGATKLLEREANCLDRDSEAKNSILVTWQISFNYLRCKKTSAADLLSLMCFFDRQEIPENLLQVDPKATYTTASNLYEESSDGESTESEQGPDFEDDIITLRNFSFISPSETGTFFTMHRLVQLTTRAWLKSHRHINLWRERFISILYQEFPTGQYENWGKCGWLFPHVRSAVCEQPKSERSLLQWAALLYRGAWYALESGSMVDARNMASKSRKQRVKLLGWEHEEAIESTAMLAEVYSLDGAWDEAEQLQIPVMETRTTKLGVDHPSTLTSMANLASTYRNQGRWEEAEQLEVQVIETRKTKLGVAHPSTLTSMANLASTFWNQGRWDKAEQLEVQVMETSKTKLGVDHPFTLTSMANLASTYRNQGRWEEAEQLEVQVIETSKTKLGVDHPDTLTSIANLASTYRNQGRWEEAEQLFVIANLASTFWNQGRWEEAEQLFVQVIDTRKTKLGVDHPDTLTSMANLASTYKNQGRWDKAEQLEVQVIEASKTKLGVAHPSTLTSIANLASTYMNQGRWEEAEQLFVQVIETSKTKLGVAHPSTLTSIANLASTYMNQGRWEEAEQLEVQVIETRKTKLGVDHPDTLTSIANLASTFWNQGRWEEAEQLFVQVMETRKTKLGVDHPSTLTSMANLASTFWNQGRWDKAEQLEVQVMETSKTKLGVDHPFTLTSMANLAFTLKSLRRNADAIELLQTCLPRQEEILGMNHPQTLSNSATLLEWETEVLDVNV